MKIFDPKLTGSIEILNTISGNVTIAGDLTVEGSLGGSATTASYVEYSDIANKPTLISSSVQIASDISGSFTGLSSSLEQRVSANEGSVSSLNEASSSYALEANISGSITLVSSSLASRISSNEGSVDSLNSASSSYLLNTTDTLDGNLTVTGTITAQEFHTEFVSASIIYESGSTKFGDTLDDKHSFTGSLQVSGSTHSILGNLGINTTPSYNLHNTGTFGFATDITGKVGEIGANTATADTYFTLRNTAGRFDIGTSATGNYLYSVGALPMQFFTNATERMRIDSNGNLNLAASGANTTVAVFENTGGANSYVGIKSTSGTNYIGNVSNAMTFEAAGAERMRIDSNGKVGINLSGDDNTAQLDIKSDTGANALTLRTRPTNNDYAFLNFRSVEGNELLSEIYVYRPDVDYGNLVFSTNNGSTPSPRMYIKSDGNVGIGTTSPTLAKLQVEGNASTNGLSIKSGGNGGTYPLMVTWSGGTAGDAFCVDDNLFVGIGTTSPQQKLTVDGTSSGAYIRISNAASGDISSGFMIYNGNNLDTQIYTNPTFGNTTLLSREGWAIRAGGSQRMAILSNGYVGIGETSPTHKVHINSEDDNTYALRVQGNTNNAAGVWTGIGIAGEAANTKAAIIFEDIGASYSRGKLHFAINNAQDQTSATPANARLTITNDGNIGIGTTSPYRKFQVDGSAGVRNGSFFIGDESGSTDSGIEFYKSGTTLRIYTNTGAFGGTYGAGAVNVDLYDGTTEYSTRISGNGSSYFNSGYVGIGTTSPASKFTVYDGDVRLNKAHVEANTATWSQRIYFTDEVDRIGASISGFREQWVNAPMGISFSTGGLGTIAERMRITSEGNVVIGEMSTSGVFDAGSNGFYLGNNGTGGASFNFSNTNECFIFNQRDGLGTTQVDFRNGGVERGRIEWTTSGTTYNTSSDYRLKTNINTLTGALDKIALLAPKTFNYIDGNGQLINGFIAHEVQEIIPEAVTGQKDEVREDGTPKYQGMDHSRLVPFLVAAMQEQQAIIEDLKSRLEALEQA